MEGIPDPIAWDSSTTSKTPPSPPQKGFSLESPLVRGPLILRRDP